MGKALICMHSNLLGEILLNKEWRSNITIAKAYHTGDTDDNGNDLHLYNVFVESNKLPAGDNGEMDIVIIPAMEVYTDESEDFHFQPASFFFKKSMDT